MKKYNLQQNSLQLINKIYVINLKHRTDRRDMFKKVWDNLNILPNYSFYEGVFGKDITDKNILAKNKTILAKNRGLIGQLGCKLSHLNIWKDILKNKYENTLIFEDDAYITKDSVNKFKNAINEIFIKKIQFDIISFGNNGVVLNKDSNLLCSNLFNKSHVWGTHCYLIKLSGVRTLLNYLNQDDSKFYLHDIDDFITYAHSNNIIEYYSTNENIVKPYNKDEFKKHGYDSDTRDNLGKKNSIYFKYKK